MAPPNPKSSRPGRTLAFLVALIIVMLASVIGFKDALHPGVWHDKFKVGLGLDLSSGTTVTLQAVPAHKGAPVSPAAMKQAISVLLARVNGAGFTGATVQQQGTRTIAVSVPSQTSSKVVANLGSTTELRIRQVLLCSPAGSQNCVGPASAVNPSPLPTGSPSPPSTSPSGSTKASGAKASSSPKPSGSKKASGQAYRASQILASHARPNSSPSPSASQSGTQSPKPSGSPSPSGSGLPTSTPGSSATSGDPSLANPAVLKLFNKLNCADKHWQAKIYHNDPNLWDAANTQIVACDKNGAKFLLNKAVVQGTQITGATYGLDSLSNKWVVNVNLNGAATKSFAALTAQQAASYYSTQTRQATSVLDLNAIVLDSTVQSAPQTQQSIPNGQVQISGGGISGFTRSQASQLAGILKYGELQLSFTRLQVTTVTPQLGSSQLQAGLIAGLIGLLLVVIYSFIYYRGLALVSVSSLAIAALLSYLTVILLTLHNGFTLSLAGVAGLIVAIGITADSFVVYFERLRDEVREGKSLRAAVERGWQRARRTILVSDTVSFLAAALLYYFAIGDVKGFAFTLGLTTLIDIVVVFLFTKPMVTLLATTKFYGQGHRLSGLDPARLGARTLWRGSARRAPRPAPGPATATAARATPKEA